MKIITGFFIIMLSSILLTNTALAEEKRVITLSDGTRISGQVMSYTNGIYTIQTENLGELKINDSSIVSIGSGTSAQQAPSQGGQNLLASQDIKSTVSQMQATMMSNPGIMQDIEKLLQDPEIISLLSDQNFINDIMSYDPARIQANPKAQQLMNNPEMRKLMESMMQQMESPAGR